MVDLDRNQDTELPAEFELALQRRKKPSSPELASEFIQTEGVWLNLFVPGWFSLNSAVEPPTRAAETTDFSACQSFPAGQDGNSSRVKGCSHQLTFI